MEPQPSISPIVPSQSVEQKPVHSNKTFKILLLVFLFLLLAIVITYAYQNYQTKSETKIVPPAQPDLIPSPTSTDLKTYRNDEYGFEFQYPQELSEDDMQDESEHFLNLLADQTMNPILLIQGYKNPNNKTLEELDILYRQSNDIQGSYTPQLSLPINKTVTIANVSMIEQRDFACHPSLCTRYLIQTPSSVVAIQFFPGVDIQIINQILNSFRFVDEDQTKIPANWQKTNTGSFELYLPPGWKYNKQQGIDSFVGEFTGDGITLGFDYGMYSNPLEDYNEPDYRIEHTTIDSRNAKIVVPFKYPGLIGVYFDEIYKQDDTSFMSSTKLQISGEITSAASVGNILTIFRSISFKDL